MLNGFSAGYRNIPVIRELTCTVNGPCFTALVGNNGSGKTTLLKALAGKIDYTGELLINEAPVKELRTGTVSFLSQKNNLSFDIKVSELTVAGCIGSKKFFENYTASNYQKAREVLKQVGFKKSFDSNFSELSGGEQQLVWLAQLFMRDAEIYLLDEPAQNLDPYNKKLLYDNLQKWCYEYGKTVLCATHDLHILQNYKGYLLNLSSKAPRLEVLNPDTVKKAADVLYATSA